LKKLTLQKLLHSLNTFPSLSYISP
jgi:hypothetical protein